MKNKGKMSWTDERIAILKKMWKEGKSAAEIAKALGKGVTRNAVIGKAHRIGVSGRPSPIKKGKGAESDTPAVSAATPKKATSTVVKAPSKKSTAPAAPPPKKNPEPASVTPVKKPVPPQREPVEDVKKNKKIAPIVEKGGVQLIDLTEKMCKWPIGDPRDADFMFCGLGIRAGTPYCPQHAAVAYQASHRRGAIAAAVAANVDKDVVVEEEIADSGDGDDDTDAEVDVEVTEEDTEV